MKHSQRRRRSAQKRQLSSFAFTKVQAPHAKKFALHAWSIDSDLKIAPDVLAQLYNLALGAWIPWDDENDQRNMGRISADYIHLYPRKDGDYKTTLATALATTFNQDA